MTIISCRIYLGQISHKFESQEMYFFRLALVTCQAHTLLHLLLLTVRRTQSSDFLHFAA